MSPKGPKHSASATLADDCFRKNLGDRVIIRIQEPVALDEFSEPEPDVVLAAPHPLKYSDHHPTPAEIHFLLEIADTSLAFDRSVKAPLYAKAGIVHYGILNVNTREFEDYRDPGPDGYRSKRTYRAGESFELVGFPEVRVATSELLPPE